IENPCDLILYPENEEQIERILELSKGNYIAVIPYGGGTSVVGGVEPSSNSERVISLDLKRMNKILKIDVVSSTFTSQPGIKGPELEKHLNVKGFTLGHFPQSFEFSTLGGWIATRGAGQQSCGYEKIEDMVISIRVVTPEGVIETKNTPASASGPNLKELLVGSEGCFGVITCATLRIREIPEIFYYFGVLFKNFEDGVNAIREISQRTSPTMIRLSDSDEVRFGIALRERKDFRAKMVEDFEISLLKRLGYSLENGSLAIIGIEGKKDSVNFRKKVVSEICKRNHAFNLGKGIGNMWLKERFEHPYLRDLLLDKCIMVDTLETATTWKNLLNLYQNLKKTIELAIKDTGCKPLVLTHISHTYREGASLYFTFLSEQLKDRELEQWLRIKEKATECIMKNGGTLSHHHGIGSLHAKWIKREHGEGGLRILKSLKRTLDREGIMNPGKVL
ncbi:MAG: FAD-binding oxidoreductase, partial [Candidatus Methanofastidiosia archaeon]